MRFGQHIFQLVGLILSPLALTSCGSGGGGDGGTTPTIASPTQTIVSGTVMAPGGAIAFFKQPSLGDVFVSEAYAALTGLANVPDNTIIQLARLNADVANVSVITTTTTSGGQYSFNLTTLGLQPSNDLIVRIEGSGGKQMRAFVVGSVADISPVSEAAYQLATSALNGRPLSNLTLQEVSDISGVVNVIATTQDIGLVTSLNQAVTMIQTAVQGNSGATAFIAAAAANGQTSQGPGDIGNHIPLSQGNSWRYQVTKTETGRPTQDYQNTVTVNGTKVINLPTGPITTAVLSKSNPEGTGVAEDEYVVKDPQGLTEHGNSDAMDLLTPKLVPYRLMRFPLNPGSEFTQVHKSIDYGQDLDGDGRNESAEVNAEVTILSFEDVTVPSGTFTNAIKVQTLSTATVITTVSGVRVTVSGTETVWLASGAGVVRRTSLIQGGGITESVTEELLRFVPTFRFSQVSAGVSHTCGVTITGKGYCWGRNDNGQLGNGTTATSVSPVEVSGVLIFSYVGAGANHSCGLTITGQAYCWGAGFGGRLGNGAANDSIMPRAVSGGLIFTSISVFDRHTCGLLPSGQAYCWGFNESGQLGNGLQGTDASASVPVQVLGDIAFRSISAGSQHTCGVSITGQGFCWGNQESGALGNGNLAPASLPTPQAVSGGLDFSSITTGVRFTCGITTIGQAYCWGINYIGQLGNGNPPLSRGGPVAVTGGLSFISLDSGSTHSCGIANGGSTYCWGDNGSAALGNGTRISSEAPTLVSGAIVFNSIQAGAQYTCGVDAVHGSLYCWGDPFDGKLGYLGGSGPTSPNIVPFPVSTPQ